MYDYIFVNLGALSKSSLGDYAHFGNRPPKKSTPEYECSRDRYTHNQCKAQKSRTFYPSQCGSMLAKHSALLDNHFSFPPYYLSTKAMDFSVVILDCHMVSNLSVASNFG
jgi:hypothetical protein